VASLVTGWRGGGGGGGKLSFPLLCHASQPYREIVLEEALQTSYFLPRLMPPFPFSTI
jgi:hypothetical protein